MLAGVVDGVTGPKDNQFGRHEELSMLAGSKGFEGVSVWVSDSEVATPQLWSTPAQLDHQTSTSVSQTCCISFQFQAQRDGHDTTAPTRKSLLQTARLLQMPMSNTLFQNGQTSTLYAQRWVVTKTSSLNQRLALEKSCRLPGQSLRMIGLVQTEPERAVCKLETRLKPITPPRVVAASFGNIIRRLQSENARDANDSVPASTELEDCVSQRMHTGDIATEQVQVWALVTPQERLVDQRHIESLDLQCSIDSGSRLHKVLSGGGGWGIKKGLLALDPDSEYSNVSCASPEAIDYDNAIEETAEPRGIVEVVRPGDVVAFYIYDSSDPREPQFAHLSNKRSWYIHGPPSVAMGTVPSSIDTMPGAGGGQADVQGVDYIFARNHFGIVSERGIALKIATHEKHDDNSWIDTEQLDHVVQTKLDSPYTRISIGNNAPFTISDISSKASS